MNEFIRLLVNSPRALSLGRWGWWFVRIVFHRSGWVSMCSVHGTSYLYVRVFQRIVVRVFQRMESTPVRVFQRIVNH